MLDKIPDYAMRGRYHFNDDFIVFTACTADNAGTVCGSGTNAYCDTGTSQCACDIIHSLADGVCAPICK